MHDDARTSMTLTDALGRLQTWWRSQAHVSVLNALLRQGSPDHALPSPALGIATVETSQPVKLEQTCILRPVISSASIDQPLFTPIPAQISVLPWALVDCAWIRSDPSSQSIRGLRLRIDRTTSHPVAAGWLSLAMDLGDWTPILLPGVQVRWRVADESVPTPLGWSQTRCRRPKLVDGIENLVPRGTRVVQQHLARLQARMLRLFLPETVGESTKLEVEILFLEAAPRRVMPSEPAVWTNAIPIWNSVPRIYPDWMHTAQSVGEHLYRYCHPLDGSDPDRGWRAWNVSRVGGSRTARLVFTPRGPTLTSSPDHRREDTEAPSFEVVLLPEMLPPTRDPVSGEAALGGGLAICLSEDARAALDRRKDRLRVDFSVTLGAGANGLAPGVELQVVDSTGGLQSSGVRGSMIGSTWGGIDPWPTATEIGVPSPDTHAAWRIPAADSVSAAADLIHRLAGGLLEVVDLSDLLRWDRADHRPVLRVRVRWTQSALPAWQRRWLLSALEAMVGEEWMDTPGRAIELIEEVDDQ